MPHRDPTSAARVLLFLLLLTPVSPRCRKGTAEECKKADFVPGYKYAGIGIDIVKLETTDNTAFPSPYNDLECTLCENPFLEGKPFQRLPSFTDWKANMSCLQKVQHSVHQSPISLAETLTALKVKNDWRKGLDVKNYSSDKVQWALAGSRSSFTEIFVQWSSQDKYTFFLDYMSCSFYKFHVNKITLLTKSFRDSLNNLPEKYNNDSESDYFNFIRWYGTHWAKEVDLGAHLGILTFVSECEIMLEGLGISELSNCVNGDVGFHFDLNTAESEDCGKKLEQHNLLLSGGSTDSDGMESAKSEPGLISYTLEPLHTLLDESNPRKEILRQALSDYVRQNTLWRNCSRPCPAGSQFSSSEFCSCECPSNNFINSRCCAPKRGTAKLTVRVGDAKDLWGDHISRSDGYVSVSFKNRKMCTDTVWNNNNPTWNATLDFGVIELEKDSNKLKLEVWDQDYGWNDDLLGQCSQTLDPWIVHTLTCFLKHGQMHFSYRLVCGPKLQDSSCWDYIDTWPFYETGPDHYHYERDL